MRRRLVYYPLKEVLRGRRHAEEPGQVQITERMVLQTLPKPSHRPMRTSRRSQRSKDWNRRPGMHAAPDLFQPIGAENLDSTDVTYIMKRKNLLILSKVHVAMVTPVKD